MVKNKNSKKMDIEGLFNANWYFIRLLDGS